MSDKNFTTGVQVSALFVALLLLGGCSSKVDSGKVDASGDPIIVSSASGDVRLEIPKSALPEGVTANQISISAVPESELPTSDDVKFTGYKLEPDGLKFNDKVRLRIPIEKDTFPFFLHSYGENLEPIQGVNYVLSDEGSEAIVRIDHFSTVIEGIGIEPIWEFSLKVEDTFVGQKIPVTAQVKLVDTEYRQTSPDGSHYNLYVSSGDRTLKGDFLRHSNNITPLWLNDRPTKTSFNDSYTVRSNDFTCNSPGPAALQYRIWLTWGVLFTKDGGGAITDDDPFPIFASVQVKTTFECKVPPPPPVQPRCGDNKADTNELCDGTDLRGKTCVALGYPDGGTLACDSQCYYDTHACKIVHKLSCNQNTWTDEAVTYPSFTCQDDCSEGSVCDAKTCTCKSAAQQADTPKPQLTIPGAVLTQQPETPKIKVVQYGEHLIPADQVYDAGVAVCGTACNSEPHWHSNGRSVTTVKGVVLKDPDPPGCGFGKVSEHPVIETPDPTKKNE